MQVVCVKVSQQYNTQLTYWINNKEPESDTPLCNFYLACDIN